jgi:hypothetical protein
MPPGGTSRRRAHQEPQQDDGAALSHARTDIFQTLSGMPSTTAGADASDKPAPAAGRASLNTFQLVFSLACWLVLLIPDATMVSTAPLIPLLLGAACTLRELARYENPLALTVPRVAYALFWTAPSPFNILPYKSVGAMLWAEPYTYAFAHFITGHQDSVNLSLHALALALSLVSQFALTAQAGQALGAGAALPPLALLAWGIALRRADERCSPWARKAAVAAICAGYYIGAGPTAAEVHWSWW